MRKFSTKQIIWIIVILSVVILGFMFFGRTKTTPTANTTTVTRGDINQEVSVTGRIKPTTTTDLSFEKSGRITGVYTRVGDHVVTGTLLAEVESSSAQASLLEATAHLAELKRGSRPEEITVKEAEVAKYNQDLANSYAGTKDTLNDAFTKSDDALHVKMTGIFSGYKTSSYKFTYQICDSQLDVTGTQARYDTEVDFEQWRAEITALPSAPSNTELEKALNNSSKHLERLKAFFEIVNRTLTLDCTVSNTALDTYRTNVNLARTNITTASSNINTKEQNLAALALTVAKAKDELALMNAGTATEIINAQEARVLGAQGELRKYRIYAPQNGIMTRVDAKIGESSNISTPLFSIISDSSFSIEAAVPEADIAKIKIGENAKITLDAYGSDAIFLARVTMIDPAETIIDNVPTYKVTLHFIKNDSRIKSGMTANIDISTGSKKDVLRIPERAVITRANLKFVRLSRNGNTTTEVPLTLGLKGSDGSIEVTSGLNEGETIVSAPLE
jgi:multidrug efflux pump subunit AcrA (membrane-fusion protein)